MSEEKEHARTCEICGFQTTHKEDIFFTMTGAINCRRCYCKFSPYGTYTESPDFTKRYERWEKFIAEQK